MNTKSTCPIGKLDKLLIATDGTAYSEGAIREGIQFASKCSSKIYVCMTLSRIPGDETASQGAIKKERSEAYAHLNSIKERANKSGVTCEIILHELIDASKAIVDEAIDKEIDMIVIGKHGYKGLAKALIGEVAAKVIGNSPCNVMVVPKAAHVEYKNILVAVRETDHSKAAVQETINLAKRNGSHIIALSAMRDESERQRAKDFSEYAAEMARAEGVSVEAITPTGRSFNTIVEEASGRGVDLIVIGAYGKPGIKQFVMGSSTEKVIGNTGCAVLVVRAK